jgi:hypothetical protein
LSRHVDAPYLSVVVTTRNDDHGGNPLWRLQALIDMFDAQCRRSGLDAEVIIVEWNPPPDRKRLADVVTLPGAPACHYRFIELPQELHRTLAHADALPLFQMIAKNVGIRRARGEFVLATNIDIICSNEIVDFIARRALEEGCLYRVDRHDVESQLPTDQPVDARIQYCRSHQLRINSRWGTFPVDPDGRLRSEADDIVDGHEVTLKDGWHVREWNVYGCFRWAMPEATIVCDLRQQTGMTPNVLELELAPNPYDPGASVDIDIVDRMNRLLGSLTVGGRAVYRLPLTAVPDEVRLRVRASSPGTSNVHGLLERRQSLAYEVRSIRLRRLADPVAETGAIVPNTETRERPEELKHVLVGARRRIGAVAAKVSTSLTNGWLKVASRFGARPSNCSACEEALSQATRKWEEIAPLSEVRDVYRLFRGHSPPDLHLNACGDFQLMSRRNWIDLRGYPEVHAYSMNLDGLFSTLAFYAGVEERALELPCCIYHLEHESGSGWTPEGEDTLRSRLEAKGIPWIDSRRVSELSAYMAHLGRPMIFNDASWGFGDHILPEVSLPATNPEML